MRPLTYAAALADWYEASLTILHVVPTFEPMQVRGGTIGGIPQLLYPPSRDEIMEELRQAVGNAGVNGGRAVLKLEAGDAVRTVIDQAVELPADILVMGTHGRSGFERFMVGSVTEKVLRKAPCQVLTVPPHAPAALPAEVRFKKVLCPMDFSPPSMQALGFALDLARQADGTVTVLHAIEWLAEEGPEAHAHVSEYRQRLIDDARERIQALVADEPRTWAEIKDVVVFGRAHREVLRYASETQPDLIVMGAQGRGGIGLALFGSTTQEVVRSAPCAVLSVRSAEIKT